MFHFGQSLKQSEGSYPENVGDIPFDKELDDPSFKVWNEKKTFQYYNSLKRLGVKSKYLENMNKAKSFYVKGYKRVDPYTHPMDKVYLADIERELL